MSAIVLRQLKLSNFKGVREFEIAVPDSGCSVIGENGTGKTTLADAWSWLLTGRDSRGSADFSVKTLDEKGNAVPHLDHAVEATVEVDGRKRTLSRIYREKWVRKRGAASPDFSGHETSYSIDGVPKTKAEFEDFLSSLCPPDLMAVLIDPMHFADRMHWPDRRALLIEATGGVEDQDVIESTAELADLASRLGGETPDELKARAVAKRKAINSELATLPARIDELRRGQAEAPIPPSDQARDAQAAEIASIERDIAALKAGGESEALASKARGLRDRIHALRNDAAARLMRAEAERRENIRSIKDEQSRAISSARNARLDAQTAEEQAGLAAESLKEVEQQRADASAEPEVQGACATCGQVLPADKVEEMLERARAAQAALLESLIEKSRRLEEMQACASRASCLANVRLSEAEAAAAEAAKRLAEAESKPAQAAPPKTESLERELKEVEERIAEAAKDSSGEVSVLEEKLSAARAELGEMDRLRAEAAAAAKVELRIEDLAARQRGLAVRFEDLERVIWLVELFHRRRAEMIDERVNGLFEVARFRLFRRLVNGGIEECCDVAALSDDGALVPWSDLNHAARVRAALDATEGIGRALGVAMPVFVDHAESVTTMPRTDLQVVWLRAQRGAALDMDESNNQRAKGVMVQ